DRLGSFIAAVLPSLPLGASARVYQTRCGDARASSPKTSIGVAEVSILYRRATTKMASAGSHLASRACDRPEPGRAQAPPVAESRRGWNVQRRRDSVPRRAGPARPGETGLPLPVYWPRPPATRRAAPARAAGGGPLPRPEGGRFMPVPPPAV